jgi:hypothetical protein
MPFFFVAAAICGLASLVLPGGTAVILSLIIGGGFLTLGAISLLSRRAVPTTSPGRAKPEVSSSRSSSHEQH